MATYIALIRKEKRSSFGVEFPDFPGCISAGKTLDEALRSATEALALHIRGMIEDGEEIPTPSRLEDVVAAPANRGTVPVLIPATATKGRAVRLNVTLEENLLRQIDEASAARGMTRSGFLAEAARDALKP